MKSILRRILLVGISSGLLITTPVFAGNKGILNNQQDFALELENNKVNKARDINNARGTYISSSHVGISNEGGGTSGISGLTTAHQPVDKIRIRLYLDRLNENQKWIQVDDFDYYFYPEDEPDGKLTIAAIDLEVDDQPSGYYYRVRGTHGVWKNGVSESQSTRTDGVLITNP